jgi:hypothetical protein
VEEFIADLITDAEKKGLDPVGLRLIIQAGIALARKYTGLPIGEVVDFLRNEFAKELQPVQEMFDAITENRIQLRARRVADVAAKYDLEESTALAIVTGVESSFGKAFQSGVEQKLKK